MLIAYQISGTMQNSGNLMWNIELPSKTFHPILQSINRKQWSLEYRTLFNKINNYIPIAFNYRFVRFPNYGLQNIQIPFCRAQWRKIRHLLNIVLFPSKSKITSSFRTIMHNWRSPIITSKTTRFLIIETMWWLATTRFATTRWFRFTTMARHFVLYR